MQALKEIEVNKRVQVIIEVGRKIIEENDLTKYTQRTLRAKLALQYMIGLKAMGQRIRWKEVVSLFKISKTTYTRLMKIINQISIL